MMENKVDLKFMQFKYALDILAQSTDNYMFVFDLKHDYYSISESAVDVFLLSTPAFFDATHELKNVIYPEDYEMVINDITEIKTKKKKEHNLEYRWLGKYGNIIWINCRGQVICDDQGCPDFMIGQVAEIGKQKKRDNITSLYCENVLQLDYGKYTDMQKNGYIMTIGIDNFKGINEKYGYNFGNHILASVAQCIKHCIGDESVAYRLDGDEFAILTPLDVIDVMDGYDSIKEMYKQIRSRVDYSIEQSGYHMFYTISAGASFIEPENENYDMVMKKVHFALHCAKLNGKNTFIGYCEEEYAKYIRRLDIQECLRKSIEDDYNGFELYYQPIVDIKNNCFNGAEALVRWNSEQYGFMSPVEFIPLMEDNSLIIPLGRWIIEQAVKQCKEWIKSVPDFKININLSYVQLEKSDIIKDALQCIDLYDIPHHHIVFEVTESGELESSPATNKVLKDFMDRGFSLAIDDFGTGYSNFRYIKEGMFALIKIDRLFIRDIHKGEYDCLLVQSITELAHSLNLKVCYEGVETKQELDRVLLLNPDCIQGYYFSKPIPAKDFSEKFIVRKVTAK